jgi:hypothetical protein
MGLSEKTCGFTGLGPPGGISAWASAIEATGRFPSQLSIQIKCQPSWATMRVAHRMRQIAVAAIASLYYDG